MKSEQTMETTDLTEV